MWARWFQAKGFEDKRPGQGKHKEPTWTNWKILKELQMEIKAIWVCLKMLGTVYPQWNSHSIGIMISKTIGFRGTNHFQTHPNMKSDLVWPTLTRLSNWKILNIHLQSSLPWGVKVRFLLLPLPLRCNLVRHCSKEWPEGWHCRCSACLWLRQTNRTGSPCPSRWCNLARAGVPSVVMVVPPPAPPFHHSKQCLCLVLHGCCADTIWNTHTIVPFYLVFETVQCVNSCPLQHVSLHICCTLRQIGMEVGTWPNSIGLLRTPTASTGDPQW